MIMESGPPIVLPKWLRDTETRNALNDHVLSTIKQLGEHLLLRAAGASQLSQSYRPFPVGCAVYGLSKNSYGGHVFTGHNMKVSSNGRVTCGEVIAVGAARQAGCYRIPLIAVVGNPQPDHGSSVCSNTLHPCHRCRDELTALDVIDENTVIITATFEAVDVLEKDLEQAMKTSNAFGDMGDTNIDLDSLVRDGEAETFSFSQLLELHA